MDAMNIEMLPLDLLEVNGDNARKTKAGKSEHDALVASISAHGLLHPLVVRTMADGRYEIVDGDRRFAAIKEIEGFGPVPCVVRDAGDLASLEVSAAANMVRAAMHPLDQADAIARIMKDAPEESYKDIAARFGQSELWARQRHALSSLGKEARAAFLDGRLTVSAAQVMTLMGKDAQKAYLKAAVDGYDLSAEQIRRRITQMKVPASAALFDIDDYPKEAIQRDLFGDDVWLTDRPAFEKLQHAALEKMLEAKRAEGWASVTLVKSGTHDWNKGLVRVEGRIKKADRSRLMAFLHYDHWNHKTRFDEGWASRKEVLKIAAGKDGGEDTAAVEDVKTKTADDLSSTQRVLQSAMMTRFIENELAKDHEFALFSLLSAFSDEPAPWVPAVLRLPEYGRLGPDKGDYAPLAMSRKCPVKMPVDYAGWLGMKKEARNELVVAAALRCVELAHVESVLKMDIETAGWFAPTPAFLNKYRTDQLIDYAGKLGLELTGKEKKTDLVAAVLDATANGKIHVPGV